MRRLMCIAAFGLLLTVPVWAQRGGHGGGGGHAGFGGGHAGGFAGHASGFGGRVGGSFGGGHFNGGSRGFSGSRGGMGFSGSRGFSHGPHTGFSHGPFLHNGFHHGNHSHTHFFTYGFRNNCYGYRCGWGWGYGNPWWGSAYYDPWWWWNQDDQQFDNDYYRQYDIANEMNQQSLEQQRMWREEEQAGDQDSYAPRRPERAVADPPRPEPEAQPIISPTVLVFRDQHREEVHNYAIVGDTLWNFAPERTKKIALANLDVRATEQVNEDRGVTFRIPGSATGQ